MKLEWNEKEAKYGRYWLELSNDTTIITKILLIDCKVDDLSCGNIVKYKFNANNITDDISLDEAKEQVVEYLKNWWNKRYKAAERDYIEAMEIVDFLK